ncbi:enkurin domain-containing protein 1-like [Babylonia areolata]|uniref:enkurin domain-containing protein 1-like n=1 Tax=Babylonia areolata TaxID=304850 RepID=UPI003FCFCB28
MQQGGLMMQGSGLIGSARQRKDFSMKDHMLENVRRMRQIQKKTQEKEAESVKPVKVMWKSDKYTDVPSRIKQDLENPPSSRPGSATFLRAHSRAGPPVKVESRPCTPDASDRVSVPLALSASEVKMARHDVDFIKVNGRSAKHSRLQRPPSATAQEERKKRSEEAMMDYSLGEVPAYLKNRKKQWKKEEEERIASIPDPAMPPGHRALPENERLETLALLQNKEKELVRELAALPIGTDTVRVRNKRKETESKLAELEEALRIFSRPKVFVKVDS